MTGSKEGELGSVEPSTLPYFFLAPRPVFYEKHTLLVNLTPQFGGGWNALRQYDSSFCRRVPASPDVV